MHEHMHTHRMQQHGHSIIDPTMLNTMITTVVDASTVGEKMYKLLCA